MLRPARLAPKNMPRSKLLKSHSLPIQFGVQDHTPKCIEATAMFMFMNCSFIHEEHEFPDRITKRLKPNPGP